MWRLPLWKAGLPRMSRAIPVIPLFAKSPTHSSVPLAEHAAVARSSGQGRTQAGARLALDGCEHDGIGQPSASGESCKELKQWTSSRS